MGSPVQRVMEREHAQHRHQIKSRSDHSVVPESVDGCAPRHPCCMGTKISLDLGHTVEGSRGGQGAEGRAASWTRGQGLGRRQGGLTSG